jgi:LPS-assembly lipoprotein
VATPDTPDGFRLRATLEDRLGSATPGAATLTVDTEVEPTEGGVLPAGASARMRLDGRATWRLVSGSGAELARGEERAFSGATIAGPAVSVRATQADARERLMRLLADRIVAQLLLLPPEALP